MNDYNNDTNPGESARNRDRDTARITACKIDGDTVMFDVNTEDRWLQSDTTVDLADNV